MEVKRGERDRQRTTSQDSNMGSCTICHSALTTRPGSPNSVLEGHCPAEFSSKQLENIWMNVSSMPSYTLMSCSGVFNWFWS